MMQAQLFKRTAVLIEQNPVQSRLYQDILSANGFDVYVAKSAMDGFIKLKESKKDLAVINTEIADEIFIDKLINKIKMEYKGNRLPIIGLSIYNADIKKNIAKKLDKFLTKPLSVDKFMETVMCCVENKNESIENIDN